MKNDSFEQISSILKLDTKYPGKMLRSVRTALGFLRVVIKAPLALRCLWLNSAKYVGPRPEWGRLLNGSNREALPQ